MTAAHLRRSRYPTWLDLDGESLRGNTDAEIQGAGGAFIIVIADLRGQVAGRESNRYRRAGVAIADDFDERLATTLAHFKGIRVETNGGRDLAEVGDCSLI